MSLDDRLLYIVLGVVIGFALGYLTAMFRSANEKLDALKEELDEVKEELDEVDKIVKGEGPPPRSHDERGVLTTRLGMNIALFIVVALTAFSAFRSQEAANSVDDSRHRQEALTSCTAGYLAKTIKALNVRTTYTRDQATANVELQRAQADMLTVLLHKPPFSQEKRLLAFKAYFHGLKGFVNAYGKAEHTANGNPYPTVTELSQCIEYRTQHSEGG